MSLFVLDTDIVSLFQHNHPAVRALESITDADHLDLLALRLLDVGSWEELFAEPANPKARRRKGNG